MSERTAAATPIDWAEIRRRIETVGAAIDAIDAGSPERARAILEERAARLARPQEDSAASATVEVLICSRGGETWAIETRFVVEVMRIEAVTPLPGAESDVVGVTAWRGEPLVLRSLADSTREIRDRWVVSVGEERAAFGLVFDAMPTLAQLPLARVHPPAPELSRERTWLSGVTDDAVLVVDGDELIRSRSGGSPS